MIRKQRKKQFSLKLNHDLALVKEVEKYAPYSQGPRRGTAWTKIAHELNSMFATTFDKVAVSRRFEILLTTHRKTDVRNRYRCN